MTRIAKLYDRLASGSAISFDEFERLLRAFGFVLGRTSGSHRIYKRTDVHDRIVVQPKGKAAKPYQLRQFLDIIESNGLTLDGNDE
ncbi:type II toxin-antitoxin system HicA family toxin [Sphingomonas sp. SUN019]|uniref:type II toxin-antitoxin system HicA family toxin n=1 Tax=Sphingomonas sp. SUN019 TaxID=2937788 RepID=UPI002164E808|nr:type II toxin-antitoxin system HicA family toxin [Sphingomonas sp. SUN019]UVO50348.1 type II toxin-antitoxin system HicA family toxin [Sphingomonas sp. SUN019]